MLKPTLEEMVHGVRNVCNSTLPGYEIKPSAHNDSIPSFKIVPSKIMTQYDLLVKRTAQEPGPNEYNSHTMTLKDQPYGKFLKRARSSIFEDEAKAKLKNPAPNTYNP